MKPGIVDYLRSCDQNAYTNMDRKVNVNESQMESRIEALETEVKASPSNLLQRTWQKYVP